MDIVFIAHFAGSPSHGMVYGHYYLAREWARAGHSVTIVAASFAHTRFRQPEQSGRIQEEQIDGIRYVWLPTPSYSPAGRLGRVMNILSFAVKSWLGGFSCDRADLVICSSHHTLSIYAARKLALRYGARLVFEVRDLWPLTLIELGGTSQRNPFIWLMQRAEDYAYRHADQVVSVLPAAADYMVSHGLQREKFSYIPNGVDMDVAPDQEPLPAVYSQQLRGLRAKGKIIVGYAGRIGLANALHTLIDAVATETMNDVCLAILGDGAYVSVLKQQVERYELSERVLFLPSVPKRQVGAFLKLIDVAYIGLQNKPLFRFGVSPTKLNDYMLAARPIICAIDAPGNIVEESGAGIGCRAEDPGELRKAIQQLTSLDDTQRQAMGESGRRWIENNRDYKILAQRFLDTVTVTERSGEQR